MPEPTVAGYPLSRLEGVSLPTLRWMLDLYRRGAADEWADYRRRDLPPPMPTIYADEIRHLRNLISLVEAREKNGDVACELIERAAMWRLDA